MMKRLIIYTLFALLMASCGRSNKDDHEIAKKIEGVPLMYDASSTDFVVINTQDVDVIEPSAYNTKISRIKYVGIQSKEPIGSIYQTLVNDDYIYILDNQSEKIFIFSTDGKCINTIDARGGGPGEYVGLGTMCLSTDGQHLIVSDRLANRFLYFSLEGQFIKKTPGISGCFIESFNDMVLTQLAYGQSYSNQLEDNYQLISAMGDSVINKAFPMYPIQKEMVNAKVLMKTSNSDVLVNPLCSDTVYQYVNKSEYTIKYVFKQPKSLWEKKMEESNLMEIADLMRNAQYTSLRSPILDTERFLSYRIERMENGGTSFGSTCYFYDKVSGRSFTFGGGQNISSLQQIIPSPEALNHDFFVGRISSTDVESFRKAMDVYNITIENDALRSLLESDVDWESIVVFYELK
jgi:hypothetical protein